MRILLVEDDAMNGSAVRQGLIIEGYAVDWAQSAADAELALETGDYGLVLLDLGLPDRSGLELLADLRNKGNAIAVRF